MQQASDANPTHKGIAGEYGRLLLEFNHITQAEKLLELADDPTNPDWKVVSARGTVFAKQSQYSKAVPLFERALQLAPDQPSVMSNLALAYAMMAADVPPDRAAANIDYLKQMVKAEPKPIPKSAAPDAAPDKVAAKLKPAAAETSKDATGWSTNVAAAKPAN